MADRTNSRLPASRTPALVSGVAEAHQLLRDNRHLGKIAILIGATEEGQGKTEEGPGAIRAEVGA